MMGCWYLVVLCYATYTTAQTCSPLEEVVPGTINKRLNSYQISHLKEFELERCALECVLVARCKSFNYRKLLGVCELNAVNLDEADIANYETETDFVYHDIRDWNSGIAGICSSRPCGENQRCVRTDPPTCVDVDCGPPRNYLVLYRSPPIHIVPSQGFNTSLGSVAQYECIGRWVISSFLYRIGEAPYLNHRLTVCSSDGQWSKNEPMCFSTILSCESVRACNPAYGDGHYWVYSGGYLHSKVKVYCHDMADVPKTYVTLLQGENVAFDAGHGAGSSTTVFSKIRIQKADYNEFSADPSDFTFATSIGGTVPFGEAASCLFVNNEKVYGYFKINTSGTGLKLRTTWQTLTTGNTELVDLTVSGSSISGKCWGSCGRCFPDTLHLDINLSDQVDGSDTVYVV